MKEWLDSLNASQLEAVTQESETCVFVIAGPGSGKTATICARVRFLIEEKKIAPERILVITFTKAAAISMQQRFFGMVFPKPPVNFGTFHACFYQILRNSGRFRQHRILGEDQKRRLLLQIGKELGVDIGADTVQAIMSAISYYKNTSDLEKARNKLPEEFGPIFGTVFEIYEKKRQKQNGLDFDDMVYECRNLLRDDCLLRREWQKRFSHILVDEFQDINPMQYEVLCLLAGGGAACFAVGDDDQAIYGFRGSEPAYINRFIEDFKAKQIILGWNYRSTQSIIDQAGIVIAENKHRIIKPAQRAYVMQANGSFFREETDTLVRKPCGSTEDIRLRPFETREEAYKYLVETLRSRDGNCAVLFRTNTYMQSFAVHLAMEGIPYEMKEKGACIYDHFVALDIMAYLRLAGGNCYRREWLRILNRPDRGLDREIMIREQIGTEDFRKLYLLKSSQEKLDGEELLSSEAKEKAEKLLQDMQRLKNMSLSLSVKYICKAIDYDSYLEERAGGNEMLLSEWKWISDWLVEDAKAYSDLNSWERAQEKFRVGMGKTDSGRRKEEPVRLMTVHGAKGLEYDHVWIPDCNEKIFPHGNMPDEETCEEERRLFYVAMTRAKKSLELLYLTGTKERPRLPSRFLNPLFIHQQAHQTHRCPDIHQRHQQPFHTPRRPR